MRCKSFEPTSTTAPQLWRLQFASTGTLGRGRQTHFNGETSTNKHTHTQKHPLLFVSFFQFRFQVISVPLFCCYSRAFTSRSKWITSPFFCAVVSVAATTGLSINFKNTPHAHALSRMINQIWIINGNSIKEPLGELYGCTEPVGLTSLVRNNKHRYDKKIRSCVFALFCTASSSILLVQQHIL